MDGAAVGRRAQSSGASISGALPENVLLAVIGVTLLYFGVDLLRTKHDALPAGRRELDVRAAVDRGRRSSACSAASSA